MGLQWEGRLGWGEFSWSEAGSQRRKARTLLTARGACEMAVRTDTLALLPCALPGLPGPRSPLPSLSPGGPPSHTAVSGTTGPSFLGHGEVGAGHRRPEKQLPLDLWGRGSPAFSL